MSSVEPKPECKLRLLLVEENPAEEDPTVWEMDYNGFTLPGDPRHPPEKLQAWLAAHAMNSPPMKSRKPSRTDFPNKTDELSQAREALQESENRLAGIIQSAMDAIISVDEQQCVVLFNPAAEKMFGRTAADAVGRNLNDLIPQRFRCAHAGYVRSFAETAVTSRDVAGQQCLFALRADGTEFPAEISISQSGRGEKKLFTAIVRDVSERRGVEEKAQHLALVVESSEDAIHSKDLAGTILTWNKGAERLYGYTHEEIVGRTATVLAPADREGEISDGLRQIAEGHTVNRTETVRRRKDGSLVEVSVRISPIRDRQGRITGASSVAHDISERKRAEEQLQRKTEELERSNQDLEQFAYVASHDLQEPLRMVSAYTQLLAERYRGRLGENADLYIGYAVEGATRMQALIQDLLAFSRVGRQARERKTVDCADVIDEVRKNLHAAIAESSAILNIGKLPLVFADRSQMVQLFQNLISNAMKFHGKQSPEISISAEQRRADWIFAVADNGIGIAPEHCDRIFEVFQRLHSRAEYPGNGIGLAICKKIIEHHGGRIWAESEVGKGSIFKFSLSATKFVTESMERSKQAHAGA